MDIGTLRGLGTLLVLIATLGVICWAYSGKRKADFDEMAQMPFREEPPQNKGANSDE